MWDHCAASAMKHNSEPSLHPPGRNGRFLWGLASKTILRLDSRGLVCPVWSLPVTLLTGLSRCWLTDPLHGSHQVRTLFCAFILLMRLCLHLRLFSMSEMVETLGAINAHRFVNEHISRPSACSVCTKFIWGLTKEQQQAVVCNGCGLLAHSRCASLVDAPCQQSHFQLAKQEDFVPDAKRANCVGCKGKFDFLKRKHHCRRCGDVFCDSCAPKRPGYVYPVLHLCS
jgi:hypothetical protein